MIQTVKKRVSLTENISFTSGLIKSLDLQTVCTEAMCPNIYDCYSRKKVTFIILGNICTRNCMFCAVKHGNPDKKIDTDEPNRIAYAVLKLGLKHAVITSVTRDDLVDGGAEQFVSVVKKIRMLTDNVKLELLVPDFGGDTDAVKSIVDVHPDIIAHNIETVPRLYPKVRAGASYIRSLELLKKVKDYVTRNSSNLIKTKSGLMVGLGETITEIKETMSDLKKVGCEIFTIGQYLQPTKNQLPVRKYYTEKEFELLYNIAKDIGFNEVYSGYFIRSSYV
jgi:lipoic acid synthetase